MKSQERDGAAACDRERSLGCAGRWSTNAPSASPRSDGAGTIETLSTDDLPPTKRIEFWNDVVCSTFITLNVDVAGEFKARVRRSDLGNVRLAIAESSQATVTRSRAHVSRDSDAHFFLHLQLAGSSVNQQTGREIVLSPGDLTLIDSIRPYRVAFCYPTSILVVRIPRELLRQYVACPEALTMLPLPRSSGTCRIAARFIRDLWRRSQQVTVEGSESHLTDALMSVVAAAYTATPRASIQGSAHAAVLRMRLIDYIEANLGDPELTPTAIAQTWRISRRYLHLVFRAQGESVGRYIQRRRLEECARVLRDRLRAASSITEIACEYGFNSTAHFCRTFRECYGTTPSDFRLATRAAQPFHK